LHIRVHTQINKKETNQFATAGRWPGAALIVIKGHKHLRDCAYIGDNSSEEEDEVMLEGSVPDKTEKQVEAKRLPKHVHRKLNNSTSSDSASQRRHGKNTTKLFSTYFFS
jgi:hypothetical protein